MAHEIKRNSRYYCVSEALQRNRLGAICDFRIVDLESGGDSLGGSTHRLVEWILEQRSPFDSPYYYESDSHSETLQERPIHVSYSFQSRRNYLNIYRWRIVNEEGH